MVHLVWFSPSNLSDPVVRTDAGSAALVACLRSLLQNCLLLDFSDYRFDDAIREQAEALPEAISKRVKVLLAQFAKRQRIIRAVADDYSGKEDLELLAEQGTRLHLELVVLQINDPWDEITTTIPRVSVVTYALSDFEAQRSEDAADRHFADDAMPGSDFINRFLVPFLRYSQRLDIVDGGLGQYYRGDYRHTIGCVVTAISLNCWFRDELKVTLHCWRGDGKVANNIARDVAAAAAQCGLDGHVHVQFYGTGGGKSEFKHDRCLVSELGVINIGRGLDFVRERTGMLRDTTVGFGGPDADTILRPYATLRS